MRAVFERHSAAGMPKAVSQVLFDQVGANWVHSLNARTLQLQSDGVGAPQLLYRWLDWQYRDAEREMVESRDDIWEYRLAKYGQHQMADGRLDRGVGDLIRALPIHYRLQGQATMARQLRQWRVRGAIAFRKCS